MHLDEFFRLGGCIAVIALVILIVVGCAFIAPQIGEVVKIPARAQVEYAQAQADSLVILSEGVERARVLPTMSALKVLEQESAVGNARIAALAQADAERMKAGAWQTVPIVGMVLGAMLIIGVLSLVYLRQRSAERMNQYAIDLTMRTGGTVMLPNGHTVQYLNERERAALLAAGASHTEPAPTARDSQPIYHERSTG